MKKYLVGAVAGVIISLIGSHVFMGFRVAKWKNEARSWQEAWQAQKEEMLARDSASNARIEELLENIGGLQGNIDSLMTITAGLEEDLAESRRNEEAATAEAEELRTAEVEELIERNPALKAFCLAKDRVIETKDRTIFTLVQERDNYREMFFSSERKCEDLTKISVEYQGQLEDARSALRKVELRLSQQDKRVAWLERRGAWKTYGIVAGGIVTLAAILL